MTDPTPHRIPKAAVAIAASLMALTLLLGGAGVALAVAAGSGALALPAGLGIPAGTAGGAPTGDGRAGEAESTGTGTGQSTGGADAPAPAPGETAAAETPVVEEPDLAVPTVLILDASGSMVRDAPGGGTRMDAAKAAAMTLVENLPDDSEIGLSVFGTGTGNSDAEQAAGCLDTRILLPVGPLDRTALASAIGAIHESGFTPLGPALRHAADQLPAEGPSRIVLVSDGVDTCAPPPSCEVAQELRSANPDLTIYAIGFAVDADEAAQEQLQCIGEVGGGEYYSAANAAQLAAKLRLASDPDSAADSVTDQGFEGFRLGMTLESALAVEPDLEVGDTIDRIVYVHCDYATLQFRDGVLVGIIPVDERPTADGLAPGDSLDTAYLLYGEPTDRGTDSDGSYVVFPSASNGINGYRVYYSGTTIRYILVCICGPNQAQAALNLSGWTIGYGTIGPIATGMDFEDVYAALPDGGQAAREARAENDFCPVTWAGGDPVGGSITIYGTWTDTGGVDVVSELGVYGWGLSSREQNALPRTDRGIGVGSSASQVEEAYPGVTFVGSERVGDYAVVTSRSGTSLLFLLEGSTVRGMLVGPWTSPPYEFCG